MEGRHRYPEDYEIRQRPLHTHTHIYIHKVPYYVFIWKNTTHMDIVSLMVGQF
jgi:hypothetical protein